MYSPWFLFGRAGLLQQTAEGKSGRSSALKVSCVDLISNEGSAKVAKSIKSLAYADDVKFLDGNSTVHLSCYVSVCCAILFAKLMTLTMTRVIMSPRIVALAFQLYMCSAELVSWGIKTQRGE